MAWQQPSRVTIVEQATLRRPNVFGPDVISLASGDPSGLVPRAVVEAVEKAVGEAKFGYAHPDGLPALRTVVAGQLSQATGRELGAADVLVTSGASSGLGAVAFGLLSPGDRVLLPSPVYSLYADVVRLAGAIPEFVSCEPPDYQLPLDDLETAADGAAAIFICNPCNPTGAVYPPAALRSLGAIAERHDLLVISDEAYSSVIFPPAQFSSAISIPELAPRVVLVDTFSKRLCITGLRLGYVTAAPPYLSAIRRAHRTLVGPVNTPVQMAIARVLADEATFRTALLEEFTARRADVFAELSTAPEVSFQPPRGTFYAFFAIRGVADSDRASRALVAHGVAVRPGAEFGKGGEGSIRVAFCGDRTELREGLRRLVAAIPAVQASQEA